MDMIAEEHANFEYWIYDWLDQHLVEILQFEGLHEVPEAGFEFEITIVDELPPQKSRGKKRRKNN